MSSTGHAAHDLGLIIPTKEEFDYVRESIPFTPIPGAEGGVWYEFQAPGERLGVAYVLFDMGLTPATSAATRLLERFHPEVLAVVGIGGALNDDLRLGDVVVGAVIEEYLKAAKVSSGFQPAGDGWPLAERLRHFTNHFRYITEDNYLSWIKFAKVRGIEEDLPFATTPWARREPSYFVLPIASGDLVVADEEFKEWLLSHERRRAVVEMEAAGVARAVKEYDRDVALLVMRGISDFADKRKAALDAVATGQEMGAWRRYAARNAIELLLAFLASPSFPWRAPSPLGSDPLGTALPAGNLADRWPSPPRGAWDYFMRVAQVAEAAAAGIEIVRALRPDHPSAGGEHHGSHDDSGGPGHGEHPHDQDHGHNQDHGPGHDHDDAHHGYGAGHGHDVAHEAGQVDFAHHDVDHGSAVGTDSHFDAHHDLTDSHHD
jgi:nucleoside phosphorylase